MKKKYFWWVFFGPAMSKIKSLKFATVAVLIILRIEDLIRIESEKKSIQSRRGRQSMIMLGI